MRRLPHSFLAVMGSGALYAGILAGKVGRPGHLFRAGGVAYQVGQLKEDELHGRIVAFRCRVAGDAVEGTDKSPRHA